jgi:Uma2 family endonuclease
MQEQIHPGPVGRRGRDKLGAVPGIASPPEIAPERVRPLRRDEYDRLVEAGMFQDERVELLHGVLVEMSPQSAPHAGAIQRLTGLLVAACGSRAAVRVQLPLALSEHSEPEPDLAVVAAGDYDREHPRSALLVIEVALESLAKDRGLKAALYASCRVAEYWVVDVAGRAIEVHRDPAAGRYASVARFAAGESIRLAVFPEASIAVADVLR